MTQLPTAEDVLNSIEPNGELLNTDTAVEAMIQFAKLHVQTALESAAKQTSEIIGDIEIKRRGIDEIILESYPLDNIK